MNDIDDILYGPISWTIIFNNHYHVSDDVWQGQDRISLECYCGCQLMRSWKFSETHKELLYLTKSCCI